MVHGKAMSSLKLGTLGARHPSQSPQLAAKESTMDADALKMPSKSALRGSGYDDAMPHVFGQYSPPFAFQKLRL